MPGPGLANPGRECTVGMAREPQPQPQPAVPAARRGSSLRGEERRLGFLETGLHPHYMLGPLRSSPAAVAEHAVTLKMHGECRLLHLGAKQSGWRRQENHRGLPVLCSLCFSPLLLSLPSSQPTNQPLHLSNSFSHPHQTILPPPKQLLLL